MHRRIARALTGSVAVLGLLLAGGVPTAQAYDADGYAYAAGHLVAASDIPAVLGAYRPDPVFGAHRSHGPAVLCQVPGVDASAPPVSVPYRGPRYSFAAVYDGRGGVDAPVLEVRIDQYRNRAKAVRAFTLASRRVVACHGTGSGTFADPQTGMTTTYTTQVAFGLVTLAPADAVKALTVTRDTMSAQTPGDARTVNDSYTVVDLVDDAIITTTYYVNTNANPSAAQTKAVSDVALAARAAWRA